MSVTWITPVKVNPSAAGAFTDVDVSAYCPAGTTGVIVHCCGEDGTHNAFGLRKNGSTDSRTSALGSNQHWSGIIGVDDSRIFECYTDDNVNTNVWLVGYFDSDAVFFTNATGKNPGIIGAWTDVDISSDTGANTAIAAIIEADNTSTSSAYSIGFRKNGSTDSRTYGNWRRPGWWVIGVDGSEVFEGYCSYYQGQGYFLTGYITANVTMQTNATEHSCVTSGSWQDVAALPSGATGGFFEIASNDGSFMSYGLRKNGSSENIYQYVNQHHFNCVECDGSQIIEAKASTASSVDIWLTGYSTAGTIQKSVMDSASGVDAIPSLCRNLLDTGSGAEILSGMVPLSLADTGTGVDAPVVIASPQSQDSGAGSESLLFLAGVSVLESGSGIDVLSALISSLLSDSGAGSEIISKLEQGTSKLIEDSGVGTGLLNLLVLPALTDSAAGVDSISLLYATGIIDSGLGIDLLNANAASSLVDAGFGSDGVIIVPALIIVDVAAGSEQINRSGQMLILDSGTGLDMLSLLASKTLPETAAGIDALSLLSAIEMLDSGAGSDDLSVRISAVLVDSAVGFDLIVHLSRVILESGAGVDVLVVSSSLRKRRAYSQTRKCIEGRVLSANRRY